MTANALTRWRRSAAALAMLGAVVWLVAGCERFDTEPREVAERFWSAVHDGRLNAAGDEADAADLEPLRELAERHRFTSASFGRSLRDDASALVETRLALETGPEVEFHTHLVRTSDGWRVVVGETRRELTRAALAASFDRVREALHGSGQAVVQEFERRALEASEALREALESLERDLTE